MRRGDEADLGVVVRIGFFGFCGFLVVAWLAVVGVTVHAVMAMGAGAAGAVFFGDFAHPWRAQFNTDFGFHLLLIASWMIYRAKSWASGVACAVLSVFLGGVFTFGYLLVVVARSGGDTGLVVTGRRGVAR